jgi:ferric-dicitrate binding protein FerR (iron transport regulator)
MKRYLVLILLSVALPAAAAEKAGEISKVSGKVLLYRGGGVRSDAVKEPGAAIRVGDSIATKREALATIAFVDGNRVILKENSTLAVKGLKTATAGDGTVLFDIRKRGGVKGFEVTTATVTMGVRGTRFAVRTNGDKVEVAVKDGKVEVAPIDGKFRKHPAQENLAEGMQGLQDEMKKSFEDAQARMKNQFEESQQLLAAGDIEAVEQIDLEAGSSITIDGSDAWVAAFPDWAEQELALFDQE